MNTVSVFKSIIVFHILLNLVILGLILNFVVVCCMTDIDENKDSAISSKTALAQFSIFGYLIVVSDIGYTLISLSILTLIISSSLWGYSTYNNNNNNNNNNTSVLSGFNNMANNLNVQYSTLCKTNVIFGICFFIIVIISIIVGLIFLYSIYKSLTKPISSPSKSSTSLPSPPPPTPSPATEFFCSPGYYKSNNENTCTICPTGSYCDGKNMFNCSSTNAIYCPQGTITPQLCSTGYYCPYEELNTMFIW